MASSLSAASLTDVPAPGSGSAGPELPPMKLNIVIMSMGTRGDLQPKLEIAKILAHRHGHRVRFAGHPAYKEAVEAEAIEFYSIGRADPKNFQVRRQLPRKEMQKVLPTIKLEFAEMGERWWGACIGDPAGLGPEGDSDPFVADAVISIFQAFDQTSIAARMGIPLHMIGTNTRNPSKYIPHSQAEAFAKGGGAFKNKFSYWSQDMLFFQAFKQHMNDIRVKIIGLEPFTPIWQMTQFNRMRVPMTYIYSPSVLPKAKDWGNHIDVAGFVFREAPDFQPPPELAEFLAASEQKPIYIGFGSIGFPNANEVYEKILAAVKKTGVRAVLGRGWADWEPPAEKIPNVYIFDEVPHEWLFPRVSACVIHCGAGTTAMALKTGRPIVPLPVTGDQPWWANYIHQLGCGTEPIKVKDLTVDQLAERLDEVQKPQYAEAAAAMAAKIAAEEPGQEGFVRSALKTFSIYEKEGRCDVLPERPAVWKCNANGAKVSALAGHILVQEGKVKQSNLEPLILVKWPDYIAPGDPFTGVLKAIGRVWINISNDFKNISPKTQADVSTDGSNSHEEKLPASMSAKPAVSGIGALLFVLLHILRAPLTILVGLCMGFYNFIDFVIYELGSHFQPDLFASNPRLFSLPQMLGFLFLKFPSELFSAFTGPGHVISEGRSVGRGVLEVPLSLLRALLAGLNIVVGVFALTLRAADVQAARLMGERPKEDVVANARIRQGKLEAEQLVHVAAEEGSQLHIRVTKAWDEKFGNRGRQ